MILAMVESSTPYTVAWLTWCWGDVFLKCVLESLEGELRSPPSIDIVSLVQFPLVCRFMHVL